MTSILRFLLVVGLLASSSLCVSADAWAISCLGRYEEVKESKLDVAVWHRTFDAVAAIWKARRALADASHQVYMADKEIGLGTSALGRMDANVTRMLNKTAYEHLKTAKSLRKNIGRKSLSDIENAIKVADSHLAHVSVLERDYCDADDAVKGAVKQHDEAVKIVREAYSVFTIAKKVRLAVLSAEYRIMVKKPYPDELPSQS